ncbi:hypothetical protein GA0115247_113233, partial [Streptomyces sp. PalvLS-984]
AGALWEPPVGSQDGPEAEEDGTGDTGGAECHRW